MRLLKQDINVFAQLGDEGHNAPMSYKLQRIRMERTLKFMAEQNLSCDNKRVLDIAGPSVMGKQVSQNALSYDWTEGNLDETDWIVTRDDVDIVLMCEVIEHLCNPLLFLRRLKALASFDVMVVTWPIRPSWLWTNLHFHEMRLDRFEYLLGRAGYELVAYNKDKIPTHWTSVFKGVRPTIRHFYNPHCNAIIKKA